MRNSLGRRRCWVKTVFKCLSVVRRDWLYKEMPSLLVQKQIAMSITPELNLTRAQSVEDIYSRAHPCLSVALLVILVLAPCSSAMGWLRVVAHCGQKHHSGVLSESGSWEDLILRTGRTRKIFGAWHCPPPN